MSQVNSDSYTVLKYQPSDAGNLVVGIIYAVLSLWFFGAAFLSRAKWTLVLPIGAAVSAIGFFVRIPLTRYDMSLGLYIIQQMFVVISPAAFFAFNYSLFGRWIQTIDPAFQDGAHDNTYQLANPIQEAGEIEKFFDHGHNKNSVQTGHNRSGGLRQKSRFSFVPPRLVTRIFVCSDIVTFIVQVGAGGIQATGTQNLVSIGDKLFLAGVCAQGASYILFSVLITFALVQLIRGRHGSFATLPSASQKFVLAIALSSVAIIIRSVYRIIEFAQGNDGYLVSHEGYLFALDAAPLIIAISVWVYVWPPRLFNAKV